MEVFLTVEDQIALKLAEQTRGQIQNDIDK